MKKIVQKMKSKISNTQALVGIILSAIILVLLAVVMETSLQKTWRREHLAAAILAVQQNPQVQNRQIQEEVLARAALVYDVNNSKVLYSKNIDAQLPLASVTKLVTALVAESELGSTVPVAVTAQALATDGESGLVLGDSWRARDLSDFMLAASSNDAASALALAGGDRVKFITQMNQLVQQLGLRSLVFFNESGLDIEGGKTGGYGSAKDVASLLEYTVRFKPELLEVTTITDFIGVSTTGLQYGALNTNKIVGQIPGLIGGKTGFTDLAGGNLAVIFDAGIGHYIIVVVLGSTKDGRFDDVLKLVQAAI